VLPLDADDRLLPRALEDMVEQLERAPEEIGFIYPNPLHFGNRHDYYEAPAYNLHLLMEDNYCAATSLFDMRVFASGIRYAEEIVFGHEDWDLVLQMAEHEILGEVADGPTFMYRKGGFSRINAVEYGPGEFRKRIERRHPWLFGRRDEIKASWAPALSIVLVDDPNRPQEQWPEDLLARMAAQSCRDFEIVRGAGFGGAPGGLTVTDSDGSDPLARARGRWVVVARPGAASLLARANFVEAAIRLFWHSAARSRTVFGEVPDRRGVAFSPLSAEQVERAQPLAVAWSRKVEGEDDVVVLQGGRSLVDEVLESWETVRTLQWRKA
jgi:hypothetical protein